MSGYGPAGWTKEYELVDDLVEADYSWSAVGVFVRTTDGKLFWGMDSGCSCYSQWEDDILDLETLDWNALPAFRDAAMGISGFTEPEIHEWVAKMSRLVPR